MSYQIHYNVAFDSHTGEFFLADAVPPYSDQPVWDTDREAWRSEDEIIDSQPEGEDFEGLATQVETRLFRALTGANK